MMEKAPNILLFTTDQQRGDHIGLSGHPIVRTPNVDSFINEGAYFPNAYTEIPSTTGARRVLHSGKASYTCGLVGYSGAEWHEPNTLAQVLADNGYHCINVGWRNLHPRRKLYGFHTVIPHDLHEGEDDYWEFLKREVGPWAHERGHGCDANGWLARPWHMDERFHATNWTTDVTIEQLANRDPTRPWFAWCSHLRPHSPYDPPQFFWDMYINRDLPASPVGDWATKHDVNISFPDRCAWRGRLPEDLSHQMRAAYMATCTHIDYQLGYMLERLKRVGADIDNTLIIFTSDHGDMMGDHHLHRKSYAYEGSARIPFAVKYPQGMQLPAGVFEQPIGLQDVMPTILEAAGVTPPHYMTGRSIFCAIRGEKWREFMHGEHSPCYSKEEAMHYLTDGHKKYIWFSVTGEEQLFDMRDDRDELHDLANDPDWTENLQMWRKRLVELLAQRGDGFSDGEKLLPKPDGYSPISLGLE